MTREYSAFTTTVTSWLARGSTWRTLGERTGVCMEAQDQCTVSSHTDVSMTRPSEKAGVFIDQSLNSIFERHQSSAEKRENPDRANQQFDQPLSVLTMLPWTIDFAPATIIVYHDLTLHIRICRSITYCIPKQISAPSPPSSRLLGVVLSNPNYWLARFQPSTKSSEVRCNRWTRLLGSERLTQQMCLF